MSSLRLILRGLAHYRRAHLGLLLGTALAAAILTGALVVGDSVSFTLRSYALARLGAIEFAASSGDRLFSEQAVAAMAETLKAPASAVLALPGMAIYQNPESGDRKQVNNVQALGVDDGFWKFADAPAPALGRREALLDSRLAQRLGVAAGDSVALRIAKPGLLSRDAPLSSREMDASQRANFTVKAVISDAQLGRFSLNASQLPPSNFFVRLADLQQLADCAEQVNLALVGTGVTSNDAQQALKSAWKPQYGGLRVSKRGEHHLQLETNRIFLDATTEKAALAQPDAHGALTYLVNGIRAGNHFTPYSFMTAGGDLTRDLRDDEIVLNAWLAEKLDAHAGSQVTVTYYEALPSNRFEERSRAFTVKRIVSMADMAQEKSLVPDFPGLSNVESCKDWKIGMPMDQELLKDTDNEAYWREFRQTPKALVTLAAGQSMWSNRFGRLTAVRFQRDNGGADAILQALGAALGPEDVGLTFRPVRTDALNAAAQAADLGGLFLGMSFFLLIAAFVLTSLLYAFGAQQRAEELGTLAALGFAKSRIRNLFLLESLAVATPGSLVGAGLGMAYAWALMIGLARYWQDAVGHIPVIFHAQPASLCIGVVATVLCALGAAFLTVLRLLRRSASELMHADFSQEPRTRPVRTRSLVAAGFALVASAALVVFALVAPPADVAGPFFGSGTLALLGGLLALRYALSHAGFRRPTRPTMVSLALLNGSRRRGRSLGVVASLAAGGFLVLAVSSMQTDVGADADQRWSGTGGFALFGEATVPILDTAALSNAAPGVKPVGIRVHDGDDASCLNLNHAITPRVLGVDETELSRLRAFDEKQGEDIWAALSQDRSDGAIPALVGDTDTAMWTLRKKTGVDGDTLIYKDEAGKDVTLKLVGALPMRLSVFQGAILISAKSFTRIWPSSEGFRMFLADAAPDSRKVSTEALQKTFDRHGLEVSSTVTRLAMFHAVEGTYLSMFLVLGGIGLLLGATATGVVVLRNLLERRREIALLRAVGFSYRDVLHLLATEYGLLLISGAVIGAVASIIAMIPAMTSSHTGVSPLARLGIFGAVLAIALLCAGGALILGLRKTSVTALRSE